MLNLHVQLNKKHQAVAIYPLEHLHRQWRAIARRTLGPIRWDSKGLSGAFRLEGTELTVLCGQALGGVYIVTCPPGLREQVIILNAMLERRVTGHWEGFVETVNTVLAELAPKQDRRSALS